MDVPRQLEAIKRTRREPVALIVDSITEAADIAGLDNEQKRRMRDTLTQRLKAAEASHS